MKIKLALSVFFSAILLSSFVFATTVPSTTDPNTHGVAIKLYDHDDETSTPDIYDVCENTFNKGSSYCNPSSTYYFGKLGSCVASSTISDDFTTCNTTGTGNNGEAPLQNKIWSCSNGCKSLGSPTCNQGQVCGSNCQAVATTPNNNCTTGSPSSYNFCTGLPVSCIVNNGGSVSKFQGTGQTQVATDMYHDANSNFGVGTTTPATGLKFDVEGKVGATHYCDSDGNNCIEAALLGSGGSGGKFIDGIDAKDAVYGTDQNEFVGIGTDTPTSKLQVNGSVRFTNNDGNTDFFNYTEADGMGVFSEATIFFDRGTLAINPLTQSTLTSGLALDVTGKIGGESYCSDTNSNDEACIGSDVLISLNGLTCTDGYVPTWNSGVWDCLETASGGKFIEGSTSTDAVYLDGNVGIGTDSPSAGLHVVGDVYIEGDAVGDDDAATAALRVGTPGQGKAVLATYFLYDSDERLKKNITSLDKKNALESVMKLNPVQYNWKSNNKSDIGFIAQEVEPLFPAFVSGSADTSYSVSYGKIVSVLTAAIQEQQKQIETLKTEIEMLK